MNVVLIGAGRGSRLMPLTTSQPKSFTTVAGKRILDWTLDAFRKNGLDQFVFVSGYLREVVQREYPEFTFVENTDWANNNILFSLLYAREHMTDGFYSSYTDTLFTADAVRELMDSPYGITLVMDTEWRDRYRFRSEHPESDGEKMVAEGDRVVRVSREIVSEEASGEFTGVIKMTAAGAARFLEFYDDLRGSLGTEGVLAEGRPFRMAYFIHQLDRMIQEGTDVHCVPVPGDYHEIDTLQDYELAKCDWTRFAENRE